MEGEKLKLRSRKKPDLRLVYFWLEDQELMELAFGFGQSPTSFLSLASAYKKEVEENLNSFLAVETKESRLIGFCSYTIFNFEQRARIGILIGDRLYWNRGFGREAVLLLLRHLFFERKVRSIELDTALSNLRAQRCFEACGFRIIHKDWCEANERLWYEIDRERFFARFGAALA